MKIVKPSIQFRWITPNAIEVIKDAASLCYKSDPKDSEKFVGNLIDNDHTAMIEHAVASFKVISDIAISREIIRHRIFSFAQESTRYCNYSRGKFGSEISVIIPPEIDENLFPIWKEGILKAEETYLELVKYVKPDSARSVLPLCTKTETVITGNFRQWRFFLKLRTASNVHPQMIEICQMILEEFRKRVPIIVKGI